MTTLVCPGRGPVEFVDAQRANVDRGVFVSTTDAKWLGAKLTACGTVLRPESGPRRSR